MLSRNIHPATRRLRSQTHLPQQHFQLGVSVPEATLSNNTNDAVMAPARKKRKIAAPVEKFLCTSCDTERTSRCFPDFNPAVECEHLIHTCKECLKMWVEVQVEGAEFVRKTDVDVVVVDDGDVKKEAGEKELENGDPLPKTVDTTPAKGLLFGIKCPHPDCEGVMRSVNVQMAATRNVYAQFQTAERKFIGDNTPGWRWCMGAGCKAGQVHEPLLKKEEESKPEPELESKPIAAKRPKKGGRKKKDDIIVYEDFNPTMFVPEGDSICTCHACGARTCVNCDRPYHDGESCAQFQLRTKDRLEEEDRTLQKIRNTTKPCPNCKKRIEKNGGCPAMYCSQCQVGFCWTCDQVMDRGYCKCHPAPAPPPATLAPPMVPTR